VYIVFKLLGAESKYLDKVEVLMVMLGVFFVLVYLIRFIKRFNMNSEVDQTNENSSKDRGAL